MSDAKSAIADFLSRDAGQKRRKWLDDKTDKAGETLRYFLGPGLDKTVPAAANIASMLNPINDIGQAQADMRDGDYTGAAINTITAAAPLVVGKFAGGAVDDISNALMDTLTGVSMKAQGAADAGRQFAGDEFGGVGSGKRGIRAYHGSPHDFDKFQMDAQGYGVGDQAFGVGHYFADNKEAGQGYVERVKKPAIDGRSIYSSGLSDDAQELVWKFTESSKGGTLRDVASNARAGLTARQGDMPYSAVRHYSQLIDELEGMGDAQISIPGHLYEVDIKADPADFLDWDAPAGNSDTTNGEKFRIREAMVGRKKATDEVASQGYPGIKYGVGNRKDYVVFDENLINIVKKYGIAGAAAMLGVSAQEVQAAMGQDQ